MSDPFWDERYSIDEYVYGTSPNDFLAARAGDLPAGGLVVSIGEGEGRNGTFLAERGFRVIGIDQSAVALAKARRLAATRGVTLDLIEGDLLTVGLPPDIDAIVSIFCHLPSEVRAQVYARLAAALRPGGVFLIESYTPAQLSKSTGGPRSLDMLTSLDQLTAELSPPLERVHGEELERDVTEGRFHGGWAAVVQAIFVNRADRLQGTASEPI